MAVRIQRKREKGWRMPPNTVYVGRGSFFGNPFWLTSNHPVERAAAVDYYRRWLSGENGLWDDSAKGLAVAERVPDLTGKNLACWCRPDQECHADVLLELANSPSTDGTENKGR